MWREVPDILLMVATLVFVGGGIWAAVDERSRAAAWVGRASRAAGGGTRLVLTVFATILFLAVAEDVLWPDDDDYVTVLDRQIEVAGRAIGKIPIVHTVARGVSLGTGVGLAVAVVVAATALVYAGRQQAGLVLLVGTGSAWVVHGLVKLAFRVPRPSLRAGPDDPRGYGFPSGHTVVTVVAVGLLVWLCSRGLSRPARFSLYAAALLVASVTGAARIVLHAHRMSDVVGGLALGTVCLVMVMGWSDALLHPRLKTAEAIGRAPRGAP